MEFHVGTSPFGHWCIIEDGLINSWMAAYMLGLEESEYTRILCEEYGGEDSPFGIIFKTELRARRALDEFIMPRAVMIMLGGKL